MRRDAEIERAGRSIISLPYGFLMGRAFIEAIPRASPRRVIIFPFLFVGTFNKIDQYPLKMTVGPFVLHLEM